MFLGTALACLFGYLFGSISWSITIFKMMTGQDVRKFGSKNAGATNASRVLGKPMGLFIVFLDALKVIITGLIAASIAAIPSDLFKETSIMIPALFAVIGHCWPIYYKFKGGKAVSCIVGLSFLANSLLFVAFTIAWWIMIFATRRVSAASIFAGVVVIILAWIPQLYGIDNFDGIANHYKDWGTGTFFKAYNIDHFSASFMNKAYDWNHRTLPYYENMITIATCATLGGLILIFKHHANIKRLITKTEPAFFEYDKEKRAARKIEKEKVKAEIEALKLEIQASKDKKQETKKQP